MGRREVMQQLTAAVLGQVCFCKCVFCPYSCLGAGLGENGLLFEMERSHRWCPVYASLLCSWRVLAPPFQREIARAASWALAVNSSSARAASWALGVKLPLPGQWVEPWLWIAHLPGQRVEPWLWIVPLPRQWVEPWVWWVPLTVALTGQRVESWVWTVALTQGCPIFAMEGRVYAGFHSNLPLHLLISLISSLFSGWRCVN